MKISTCFNFSVLLTFLLCFSLSVFANNDTLKIKKHQLKISPFKLIDSERAIQISYEKRISKFFSSQLTLGYYLNPFIFLEDKIFIPAKAEKNLKGFVLGIENKFFLKKTIIANYRDYWAVDYFYQKNSFETMVRFSKYANKDSMNSEDTYIDSILVKKQRQFISLKFGIQEKYKNIIFDLSIGCGIGQRKVSHHNKIKQEDVVYVSRQFLANSRILEGNGVLLNFPIGFKIGYFF